MSFKAVSACMARASDSPSSAAVVRPTRFSASWIRPSASRRCHDGQPSSAPVLLAVVRAVEGWQPLFGPPVIARFSWVSGDSLPDVCRLVRYAPMGYGLYMEFIETTMFSSIRENYFDDAQFNGLQLYLKNRPDAGSIIRGSGGVRKLRWGLPGRGKRGGVRVIYYWITDEHQILFLTAYAKNEAGDLSPDAVRAMRELVKDL